MSPAGTTDLPYPAPWVLASRLRGRGRFRSKNLRACRESRSGVVAPRTLRSPNLPALLVRVPALAVPAPCCWMHVPPAPSLRLVASCGHMQDIQRPLAGDQGAAVTGVYGLYRSPNASLPGGPVNISWPPEAPPRGERVMRDMKRFAS